MKRLGVIGTLVWDRIWQRGADAVQAQPIEEWGGIAYSLAALGAYRPHGWEIVPILKVGEDRAPEAWSFLRSVPGLDLGRAVQVVPHPNNRVELRYHDADRRCERLTGGVPPWHWAELEPLVEELDALYLNFISGFEMELADLKQLRSRFVGPIYADIHSLLLGRTADGRRVPQPLSGWREWLRCADAVQLNEDELATLAVSWGDPWHFAVDALDQETRLLLVTRGPAGADYFAEAGLADDPLEWPRLRSAAVHRAAQLRTGRIAPPSGALSGDPTGCGDVWGSTLFVSLLGGCSLEEAILRAHTAAARNVKHNGASGLYAHLQGELNTADRT
ncbi:MAG TPA: carbohydrate kinase family protein [Longimicrobiaceae bacterium]|nr:carbohydrate kinase family protein [Longimicrobiaceae bacterium]